MKHPSASNLLTASLVAAAVRVGSIPEAPLGTPPLRQDLSLLPAVSSVPRRRAKRGLGATTLILKMSSSKPCSCLSGRTPWQPWPPLWPPQRVLTSGCPSCPGPQVFLPLPLPEDSRAFHAVRPCSCPFYATVSTGWP